MITRQFFLFRTIVFCFLIGACRWSGSDPKVSDPPATSFTVASFEITGGAKNQKVQLASVTPDFFKISRTRPLLGRLFVPEDYRSNTHQVVIISHRFWEREFSMSRTIIGTQLTINGQGITIIGILPDAFNFPSAVDGWLPQRQN
ncbi:MAG: ABC transporter permease [Acidobacteriota bacterium]|nr:MAG: ABC transporter permease [Acidobacteriota bacterium]